ncbi:MAG TPA: hypothetical protein VM287_00935 [Egibacteraceae bacterium]|nr:hypothetical protein [Egibacteraceae bacterium]
MTRRLVLRPLLVASLAVLFGLFLVLGAPAAHAQVPQLPDVEDPGGLLDIIDILDPEGLLDLDDLSLDELLNLLDLLDLLGQDTPPPAAPETATPAPAVQPPAPGTPAPAPRQVVQRPVGGVATGAGGATEQHGGTTLPLLALGALTLTGTAVTVTRFRKSEA